MQAIATDQFLVASLPCCLHSQSQELILGTYWVLFSAFLLSMRPGQKANDS